MQITEAVAVGQTDAQLHSLRFRFDEHPDGVGNLAGKITLSIGPVEFGSGADPRNARPLTARRRSVTVPALLEAVGQSGESVSLPPMSLETYETDDGETVYAIDGRSEPWEVFIAGDLEKKQLMMYCRFSYAGLNVSDALNNVNFVEALRGGGEFRILKAEDHTLIIRAALDEGSFIPMDPRWPKVLGWLVYIQERTGVRIDLPRHDILLSRDDMLTVYSVVKILETGRTTGAMEPWMSVSTPEQAKVALETFGGGRPAPMALTVGNHVVQLFGSDIPLGPAAFLCRETYITEEDLAELRRALETADEGSEINVRFTPFEGCPIEATYTKWLPAEGVPTEKGANGDGAAAADVAGPSASGADAAVALLQSWYDEDPEEQRDTWEKLKAVLGEERLSDRELFP